MDPSVAEAARWWSWRRQRLDRSCRGVGDALLSVVGVPGVNPWGPLALLARVPRLLKGAAVEGVVDTKRALRIPAMRRALHLLPRDTAHLAFSATRATAGDLRALVRRAGLDDAAYARLRKRSLAAATVPLTAEQLRADLRGAPRDLTPVLTAMAAEGVIVRTKSRDVRTNDFTYVATEAWLGEEIRAVEPSEALVWLAGDYLSAYGPAGAEDFAAWSGVTPRKAEDALRAHDPLPVGKGVYLHRRDERAFAMTRPHLGRVSLLPRADPYTMGYAAPGRLRFADASVVESLYERSGASLPIVLVEGRVMGTWDLRLRAANRIAVRLTMFDAPGPRLQAALEAECELLGTFLEAASLVVEDLARPPRRAPRKAARKASRKAAARTPSRKAAGRKPPRKSARARKPVGAKKRVVRKPAKRGRQPRKR